MAQGADPAAYKDALVVLAAAGVIIPVFRRMGVSSVLGFLLVGILIGPSGLGRLAGQWPWVGNVIITNPDKIGSLAELGVVFLLFMIGIELSFERLMTLRRLVFGLGGLQVLASTLALALVIHALGSPPPEALIIGSSLSLSSTAIVIQLLSDEKRLNTQTGRASFSILLFQDLAVIPLLLLVGILGAQSGGPMLAGLSLALGQAVIAVAAIVATGRYLLRPLLRLVAHARSADLFMAATLLIVVGAGLVASLAGLSMAMGAFLAGLLLAETEYRREVESIIEPFKGLMLGAFFLLVGMGIDLNAVAAQPLAILGLALGLIAVKAALIYGLATLFRVERTARLETALLLGPGGEFAFVVLGMASSLAVVTPAANETALIVVSLSMAAIPLSARVAPLLSKTVGARPGRPPEAEIAPPEEAQARVLVVGFGRVGQLIGLMLEEHKIAYLAVDQDPDLVARQRRAAKPVYYGDASRLEFLRKCGIGQAKAIAVTMDAPRQVEQVATAARQANPEIKIIARARDDRQAVKLYELGVTEAVPETFEASLQLGEAILVEAGLPMGLAIASVHERRDEHRKQLGRPNRRAELARLRLKRSQRMPGA